MSLNLDILKGYNSKANSSITIKDLRCQAEKTVFDLISNTEKTVFLTNFEVFGNVVKHCLECLIYLLNRN